MKSKYVTKGLSLLLGVGVLLAGTITACSNKINTDPIKDSGGFRFFRQVGSVNFSTDEGYYYNDNRMMLHFFDFASKESSIVCGKPNCKHEQFKSDTPPEQRCDAYLRSYQNGFVDSGKLYVITRDEEDWMKSIVTSSNLDRTNQKQLAVIPYSGCFSIAVKDGMAYIASSVTEKVELKPGETKAKPEKSIMNLFALSLQNGEVHELISPQKEYNASLEIVGAWQDKLLFEKTYCKNFYDGTNFDQAEHQQHLFNYDFTSKQATEMFKDQTINFSNPVLISGDLMFGIEIAQRPKNPEDPKNIDGKLYDLKSETVTDVFTGARNSIFADGLCYYQDAQGEAHCYNMETSKTAPTKIDFAQKNVSIWGEAGEYFYGTYNPPGTKQWSFCLWNKKDYLNGNTAPCVNLKE